MEESEVLEEFWRRSRCHSFWREREREVVFVMCWNEKRKVCLNRRGEEEVCKYLDGEEDSLEILVEEVEGRGVFGSHESSNLSG